MHKTPHKIDWPRTLEARKSGEFQSRYSYYSQRIHPGTEHQCEYLAGADMGVRVAHVLANFRYMCIMQGVSNCGGFLEVDHVHGGRKAERCSCWENLQPLCKHHHTLKHGRFIRSPKG